MSLVCNIEDRAGFVKPKPKAISLNIKQIKPLIKLMIRQGVELPDLLQNTSLNSGDLMRRDIELNAHQHQQLLLNAFKYAPDTSFGAKLGEQDFINHDSLLASRVMSCDNVHEGMLLLSEYYKLWTNQFDLCFEITDHWGEFSIIPHIEFGPTLPFYIEYLYAILYSFGCFCLGEKNIPLIFEFSYAQPEKGYHYGEFFSDTVRFKQAKNRVLLPKSLLTRKLIFSNPELARHNDKKAQDHIHNLTANDIVSRTRALIKKNALSTVCLDTTAAQLCMSSRSLRRHLQQNGHSFQSLVDEQRRSTAKELLGASKRTIQEIAITLGYNDASSFSRAFKRWESVSPKEYQQRQVSN